MRQNKLYILASFLGLVITTLVVSSVASAHWGNPSVEGQDSSNRPAVMQQHNENFDALQTALENKDYQAWKDIIDSRPRITDYINESNFDQFAQMHELMMAGKFDEAQAIRDELGLPDDMFGGPKFGRGFRMGHMPGRGQDQTNQ